MKTVNIYTDGACRGNPGDGGWGVLIEYENISKEYFGGEKNTTNNKMELKAAIHGLSVLKESCDVNITTDSKYVMDGITSWIENWKKNNNLNGKQFIASTIVSSPMIKKIALSYGVKYMETLTGFKWIGKLIKDNPSRIFDIF